MGLRYKLVPEFEHYRVGTDGSVWSQWNKGKRTFIDKWFKMKTNKNPHDKYHRVTLFDGKGRKKRFLVHRLVLLTFVGKPPKGRPYGAHNNDKQSDNRLVNLRWSSAKENTADALRSGRLRKGETHAYHKLKEKDVVDIWHRLQVGEGVCKLARLYEVTHGTIGDIKFGRSWKHILKTERSIE